ncbi:energy transducer TonB [Chryseobacterium sp. S-02]|uniref:energy transducer TonB n=1 Tax=Chryseobacterium sp. S-02 TaxID=3404064 RepID=UPI003CF9D2F5
MKHLHQNQEFRFNEVLFEHRNKEYGAYVLRNESDRILTKALFVGVSILAAVSITPFVINAFNTESTVHIPTDGPPVVIELNRVDRPDTPPVKIEPVKPTTPPNVKTYDAREVEPTRNAVEKKKEERPVDAIAGTQDNFKGEPAKTDYVQTPPIIGTGPVINIVPPKEVPKPVDKSKIETELSAEANFSGGIEAFRNKVMNNFDGSGFESGDIMKTTITFIVEIDGSISGIKANGTNADFNNEAIRTIKAISAKGKWTPGKNKQGESVRSSFRFPISMKFDN